MIQYHVISEIPVCKKKLRAKNFFFKINDGVQTPEAIDPNNNIRFDYQGKGAYTN